MAVYHYRSALLPHQSPPDYPWLDMQPNSRWCLLGSLLGSATTTCHTQDAPPRGAVTPLAPPRVPRRPLLEASPLPLRPRSRAIGGPARRRSLPTRGTPRAQGSHWRSPGRPPAKARERSEPAVAVAVAVVGSVLRLPAAQGRGRGEIIRVWPWRIWRPDERRLRRWRIEAAAARRRRRLGGCQRGLGGGGCRTRGGGG